jgi:hypothetical protein
MYQSKYTKAEMVAIAKIKKNFVAFKKTMKGGRKSILTDKIRIEILKKMYWRLTKNNCLTLISWKNTRQKV